METNEVSKNAMGGTELMLHGLVKRIDADLLNNFQIIPSRVRELQDDKIRVLWLHDLPQDPESQKALGNGGWRRFHRLVFVSNWQMQRYIEAFDIDWERCIVMQNAIEPILEHEKPKGVVRLIYTSTPHRGLDILSPVFDKLSQEMDDVELDVYSSFKLYGWDNSDATFEPLFDKLRANPKVKYHGTVPNDEVREALKQAHVFAYPSTWLETSCMCLMESMSAGLICVHPNVGALYETAANMTLMYQWSADKSKHAGHFYNVLKMAVNSVREGGEQVETKIRNQKAYADAFYTWDGRALHWDAFLRSIVELPREIEQATGPMFEYRAFG